MAGYSGTPLAKKLGIRPGMLIKLVAAPVDYYTLFSDMPEGVREEDSPKIPKDIIHVFATRLLVLQQILPGLKREIRQHGMIWVSWPKKSARLDTDLTENPIRDLALSIGLVDVKVCAVDETWSGLKLVIPLKDRVSD